MTPPCSASRVRLLVSACLLGEQVRYDGQHRYDAFIAEALGPFVDWERVCPEVDCGMPTPRPSLRLIGDPQAPRLVSRTGADLTEVMQQHAERELRRLEGVELCGYVCKSGSPSSGLERVKVYRPAGGFSRAGIGMFTKAFRERFPLVPVEDDGRLHDPRLRESFIERIFSRRRWLDLVRRGRSLRRLAQFHADHELLVRAHGRHEEEALRQLVESAEEHRLAEVYAAYERGLARALERPATVATVTAVLDCMVELIRPQLALDDVAELRQTVDAFRRSLVPLTVPLTLVQHYVRKHALRRLARQVYLAPYPAELRLRNHV